jgi:hypothetical protein
MRWPELWQSPRPAILMTGQIHWFATGEARLKKKEHGLY